MTIRRSTVLATTLLLAATLSACDDGESSSVNDAVDTDTIETDSGDTSDTSDAIAIEACNGHAELCDRKLNEVAFPATHNSMSNAADEWVPPNQNFGIERQLEDGIRGFLIDTYKQEDEVVLCHSICSLGSRPFDDALNAYRTFLEENPHEVLIFIIQDGTDTGSMNEVFEDTGLIDYVYTHSDDEEWPTLRAMIEADTRLLVTLESGSPPPAYMRKFWNIGWDTPYSFDSIEAFNCNENRGSSNNDLFLVNHWVSNPLSTEANAEEANAYDVLSSRVQTCEDEAGQIPNLVAVDFYDVGALFQVVDELNGVGE